MTQKLLISVSGLALLVGALAVLPTATLAEEQEPSLYERLGGVYAIALVVDDFIDRVVNDEVLNANPAVAAGRNPERFPGLKYQVTAMVCQVTGGPCTYTGKSMADAHEGMGITEAEWDAMVADFKASLDHFGVPEAEQQELFAIVGTTKGDIVVADEDEGDGEGDDEGE